MGTILEASDKKDQASSYKMSDSSCNVLSSQNSDLAEEFINEEISSSSSDNDDDDSASSDYSLADSYDKEVAHVHEAENEYEKAKKENKKAMAMASLEPQNHNTSLLEGDSREDTGGVQQLLAIKAKGS